MGLLTRRQVEEFKKAFVLFDDNGDGSICLDELGDVLRALGQRPTEENVTGMLISLDKDKSGTIDFEEFCDLMASKTSFCKPIDVPPEFLACLGLAYIVDMDQLVAMVKILLKMRERGQEEDPRYDALQTVITEQRALREAAGEEDPFMSQGLSPNETVYMWRDKVQTTADKLDAVRQERLQLQQEIMQGRIMAIKRAKKKLAPPKATFKKDGGSPNNPANIMRALSAMPRPYSVGHTPSKCGGEYTYGPPQYCSDKIRTDIDPYDVMGAQLYRPTTGPYARTKTKVRVRTIGMKDASTRPWNSTSNGSLTHADAAGSVPRADNWLDRSRRLEVRPRDERISANARRKQAAARKAAKAGAGAGASSGASEGGSASGQDSQDALFAGDSLTSLTSLMSGHGGTTGSEALQDQSPKPVTEGYSGANAQTEPDNYNVQGRCQERAWQQQSRLGRFDGTTPADRDRSIREGGHETKQKLGLSFISEGR
jgi:hypothetical protein